MKKHILLTTCFGLMAFGSAGSVESYRQPLNTLQTLFKENYLPVVDSAPAREPATLLLLGICLSGLALWGKRRRVTE